MRKVQSMLTTTMNLTTRFLGPMMLSMSLKIEENPEISNPMIKNFMAAKM